MTFFEELKTRLPPGLPAKAWGYVVEVSVCFTTDPSQLKNKSLCSLSASSPNVILVYYTTQSNLGNAYSKIEYSVFSLFIHNVAFN